MKHSQLRINNRKLFVSHIFDLYQEQFIIYGIDLNRTTSYGLITAIRTVNLPITPVFSRQTRPIRTLEAVLSTQICKRTDNQHFTLISIVSNTCFKEHLAVSHIRSACFDEDLDVLCYAVRLIFSFLQPALFLTTILFIRVVHAVI